MHTRRRVYMALGTLIAVITIVGSFVAATETLGLDRYLPITRGELIQHVANQNVENQGSREFRARSYRSEQRQLEWDIEKWKRENPEERVPESFEQQRDFYKERIKKLEKQ